MGFRNMGSLLVIFFIVMMVFGTQRLRTIGDDLATAIRSFRKGLQDEPADAAEKDDNKKDTNKL